MAQRTPDIPEAAKGKCPICAEPATIEDRPFCSRRCANIDLYRWLSGSYAIAGGEDADEDGDEVAPAHRPAERRDAAGGEHDD